MGKRQCYACESEDTTTRGFKKYPLWHLNYDAENNVLCHNCWARHIHNPIHNKITNPIYSPRRIRFKGERISLDSNPRIGICSECGAIAGIDINRTHMHHIEYDEQDPLAHTVELCVGCHVRRHMK